jgi:hypothetical protein
VSLELCSAALQYFGTANEWDAQRLAQARGGQGHVRHPGWGSWARVASAATSSRHRISRWPTRRVQEPLELEVRSTHTWRAGQP